MHAAQAYTKALHIVLPHASYKRTCRMLKETWRLPEKASAKMLLFECKPSKGMLVD